MDNKKKSEKEVKFKKYNIKISRREFNKLSNEELEECKEKIRKIREELDR